MAGKRQRRYVAWLNGGEGECEARRIMFIPGQKPGDGYIWIGASGCYGLFYGRRSLRALAKAILRDQGDPDAK